MSRNHFVSCYAYDRERKRMLVRRMAEGKSAGLLNAFGRAKKSTESSRQATATLFKEQTGIDTRVADWWYFGTVEADKWVMVLYKAELDLPEPKEPLEIVDLRAIRSADMAPYVEMLALAGQQEIKSVTLYGVE